MTPRPATPADLPASARLWHDTWHEAHWHLAAPDLVKLRTPGDFAARMAKFGDDMRVAGPEGTPVGFCVIREDELYQLFVAPAARGTGLAAALLADGEARLAAKGIREVWLDCVIGNDRALHFYERQGWRLDRREVVQVDTATGSVPAEVQILLKRLV